MMYESKNIHENIDTAEIAKFNHLAQQWWDPNGQCRPLHDINPIRTEFISFQCGELYHQRILDVGCGGGILSEALAHQGAKVTAIDMSQEVLEVARQHAKQSQLSIDYQWKSVADLTQEASQKYDIITCLEMLEHVPEPRKIIEQCKQLLKPGGHLILSTLNRTLKSKLFAIVAAEYILQLLPKGTHDYQKFIKPSELVSWCRSESFTQFTLRGLHYNPILHQSKLTKDVSVNYLLHCRLDWSD